ncbi:hypothetical protein [Paraliomyxa miuraensis]|uniref:hypothetical protein n=1 Tax=Paraliomyxa miuraensis TaxID=376150 RepID=UPI00224CD74C|nr:hypothetical protein [Paraliomyxa miuraensis]
MRRLTAAVLCLTVGPAVGRPQTAAAAPGAAVEPAEPAEGREPSTEAEPSGIEPPSPTEATASSPERSPTDPSPEEIARRLFEVRLEKAEVHWQEGDRLYNNGEYAEAAVQFERSYSAVPAASALYSAALSYGRGGKPVEAVRALRRYLALPNCTREQLERGDLYCTAQRTEAEQALSEQARRVGHLKLELGEGVELREVRVAGRTVPLDDFPVLLLPGTVDVEVFGMGPDERRSRPAYITAGETYELYVAPFDPLVVPKVGAPEGTNREFDQLRWEQRQRQLRTTFWVGAGLTAAAGVALAATGGLALYHQRRYDTELCEEECFLKDELGNPMLDENGDFQYLDRPYPADHEAAVGRHRPLANAMLGVTIGLGVATALVGAFAFRKNVQPTGSSRARAHVRLGGSGLVVRW